LLFIFLAELLQIYPLENKAGEEQKYIHMKGENPIPSLKPILGTNYHFKKFCHHREVSACSLSNGNKFIL